MVYLWQQIQRGAFCQGCRPPLTDPGLGITIGEDKLKARVGEPMLYRPRFDPDDGSVVDWYGYNGNQRARL